MKTALVSYLERHGLTMSWHCRRSFLVRLLAPPFVLVFVYLTLLLANPQSNKWIFIFQEMFTDRGGHGPWGQDGPDPPPDYSGAWYRWHRNGRLSYEEHYKNGKLDGTFRAWTDSGGLWLDTVYRDGQFDGTYLEYYDSHAVRRQFEYSDGKPIGHWVHYYENGMKMEELSFSRPGVEDGEEIFWHTNGSMVRRVWHDGEPWEGNFILEKGSNWFREGYKSGAVVASTNLGPISPYEGQPVGPAKK